MRPFLKVKALHAAFETGLIKALDGGSVPRAALHARLGLTPRGAELLLRSLAAFGVVRRSGASVACGAAFQKDMRENAALVEELTGYMNVAYADLQGFTRLLRTGRPAGGIEKFFEYIGRGGSSARISRHLAACTRNSARVICAKYDFSRHSYILDAGGNDGEFMAAVCGFFPEVKCGVFDLPGPCATGRRRHAALVAGRRLEFFPGSFLRGSFPKKADLIVFKSVLNDWPDKEAALFMAKAYAALPPGGKLLLIERFDRGARRSPDDCLFDLAFMQLIVPGQDFRTLPQYRRLLGGAGFSGIKVVGRYPPGFCIIECSKKPPRPGKSRAGRV